MKKIITLLAVVGMFSLQSCTETDNTPIVDNDTISEVFELKNINFGYTSTEGYTIYQTLTPSIYASDVILIYRLSGFINSATPIWKLIPRTLFLDQGNELDYDYDFSIEDFTIYAKGNYDISTTPQYLENQTFRIVIVPGAFSANLKTNNYEDVMAKLNLNESQIQTVRF